MPTLLRELQLVDDLDAAPRARRFAADVLGDAGRRDLVDDTTLVVAELVTNAVLHAAAPITVRLLVRDDAVRVEVADASRRGPLPGASSVDAMTGRGLRLVASLTSAWGVEPAPDGKVVWAELQAGSDVELVVDDVDFDALLAAWEDDETGATRFTVRLGDVPTDLLLAAKSHIDNLVREFALAASGAASGNSASIPAHLAELIDTVVRQFADARASIKRQALAAAARGQPRTTLTLTLPVTAADAGEDYHAALDAADTYARAARLLTLAAPPAHRAFRRWYVESLVAQLRAVARGDPAPPVQSFENRLLAEIDDAVAAQRASARAARLQTATPPLAAATTAAEIAAVAVSEGVAALGACGGALLVPTDDGRLAVPAASGSGGTVVTPPGSEHVDAPLPAALALRTGQPVWVESTHERDSRFPDLVGHEPDTVSVCAVPLAVAGRAVGVLRFSFDSPHLFDDDERGFVLALAAQAAQALDRTAANVDARTAFAARHQLARHLQACVGGCRDGVVAIAPDGRLLAVNARFFQLWRIPPRRVVDGDTSLALIRECAAKALDPRVVEDAIVRGYEPGAAPHELDVVLVDGRGITGYGAPLVEDTGSYLGRVWYLREDTD